MKIALLGRGKTGSKVKEICDEIGISCSVFHYQNPLSIEKLKDHDVIVAFVPGKVMIDSLDILLSAQLPIISGATGVEFPSDLDDQLKKSNIPWIQGHNFSLAMNVIKKVFDVLNKAPNLFDNQWSAHIHEVHHTKKLDSPSGTALRWGEWFAHPVEISADRKGDVVGDHNFTFDTPYETIELSHHAKDRRLFASGALWAANLVHSQNIAPGFHWFENLATQELKI